MTRNILPGWIALSMLLLAGCTQQLCLGPGDCFTNRNHSIYRNSSTGGFTGAAHGIPPATSTTVPVPTATSVPTDEPGEMETGAIEPGQESMPVEAADGLVIQSTLYLPGSATPAPGVMLLHMLGSNRAAWEQTGLVDTLLADGIAVLAVDMRGHGETGGTPDWTLAADDLSRIWSAFTERPEVDATQTAVVGASIGANMALTTAAGQPDIQTAVLLSPGLDYRGVTTEDQLAAYGDRPLFIVASSEDSYAASSSRTLAELGGASVQLEMFDGAGHGTAMFAREPGLNDLISEWLWTNLAQP
ncbi:MAG: alpha/beta fold hydrolase [Chloroflexota bacterium]